jgi:hypothetical protein
MALAAPAIGMNLAATQPDLSANDSQLVFVVPRAGTISQTGDHHFMGGSLYGASFDPAANALGAVAPLLMAKPDENFFYPSFSPNGEFIVFNAVSMAGPNDDAFYNRRARVVLLRNPPGPNPTPIELPAANLGDSLTNSWPKWSPFVQDYQGKKLLWITFSSNRDYGLHLKNAGFDNCYPALSPAYDQPQPLTRAGGSNTNCSQPQIWMAAIIIEGQVASAGETLRSAGLDRWLLPAGSDDLSQPQDWPIPRSPRLPAAGSRTDRSFPAFWLPFQDVNAHNHTAQWVEKVASPQPPGVIQ